MNFYYEPLQMIALVSVLAQSRMVRSTSAAGLELNVPQVELAT